MRMHSETWFHGNTILQVDWFWLKELVLIRRVFQVIQLAAGEEEPVLDSTSVLAQQEVFIVSHNVPHSVLLQGKRMHMMMQASKDIGTPQLLIPCLSVDTIGLKAF